MLCILINSFISFSINNDIRTKRTTYQNHLCLTSSASLSAVGIHPGNVRTLLAEPLSSPLLAISIALDILGARLGAIGGHPVGVLSRAESLASPIATTAIFVLESTASSSFTTTPYWYIF